MVTRGQATAREDFYRLMDVLFKDYKKDVRPVSSDMGPTSVYIVFSLFSVVDVSILPAFSTHNIDTTIITMINCISQLVVYFDLHWQL